MISKNCRQLIELLVNNGLGKLAQNDADSALAEAREKNENIIEVLLRRKLVDETEIGVALEKCFNVPFVDLSNTALDKDTLKILPEEILRKHNIIPVRKENQELTIATENPKDLVMLEDLQIVSGYNVKPVVALGRHISRIIDEFYVIDSMGKIVQEAMLDKSGNAAPGKDSLPYVEEGVHAPIIKIVNTIIEEAVKHRASDIHIEPQENHVFVRYRIDGMLKTKDILPKDLQNAIISRCKIMGEMDISEKRVPQDGQARMSVLKSNVDLRISTLPGKYGEKIVIRVLDKSNFTIGLEHLGFMPESQSALEDMLNAKNGIILVTGPTGSGKSTTLYACINKIKSTTKNIITLEDPIEYELLSSKMKECGITQVQINPKTDLTFELALRACLRQDPDVILIGEVRDAATCGIAINAALMGHLILSSLHTNDSVSTITRLLDMGIEPFLISSSLISVISQRLVRLLCNDCKEKYTPPKNIMAKLNLKQFGAGAVLYRPKGCPKCANTGYSGRTAVAEILRINEEIKKLIIQKASTSVLREETAKTGLSTMKQNAMQLVLRGLTSIAEVYRVLPSDI